jgi:CheY-like chemotaxis protein
MMGGTISVESVVNKGTVFMVDIPRIPVADDAQLNEESHPSCGPDVQFAPAVILIVEDQPSNREVLRAFFESYETLRVIEAANGQAALKMIESIRPDLILMDIQMPVMDGYEATQLLKAHPQWQSIPVIAITAYAMKGQREQFQTIFDAYLSKPVVKQILIQTLARFLPTQPLLQEDVREYGAFTDTNRSVPQQGPDLCQELRDFLRHKDTWDVGIREHCRSVLVPHYQDINELMSIDDMKAFAEAVTNAAHTYAIPVLEQYGQQLMHGIEIFDITRIRRLLEIFPNIAEILTVPSEHENTGYSAC